MKCWLLKAIWIEANLWTKVTLSALVSAALSFESRNEWNENVVNSLMLAITSTCLFPILSLFCLNLLASVYIYTFIYIWKLGADDWEWCQKWWARGSLALYANFVTLCNLKWRRQAPGHQHVACHSVNFF